MTDPTPEQIAAAKRWTFLPPDGSRISDADVAILGDAASKDAGYAFGDKIIYLRCYAPPAPFYDPSSPTGREDFARAIREELPAFLADVDAYQIPEGMAKGRFGQKEFHHPAILDLLTNGSHLIPLSEILESWLDGWEADESERTITTTALYEALGDRLRGVASSAIHLSRELGRLAATSGWSGRLSREHHRIANNQRQTVWRFKRIAP